MSPTQPQLDARLDPNPVNISVPTDGQVFRSGATGNLYKRVGNTIVQLMGGQMFIPNTARRAADGTVYPAGVPITSAQVTASKIIDPNFNGQDYQTVPLSTAFDQQYGQGAFNNLPAYIEGDLHSIAGLTTVQGGSDFNFYNPANTNTATATATANNTPNSLGTPNATGSTATNAISPPTTNLQPGDTGASVKQLQDYLVSKGLMTQAQVDTGYGTYGPQTTAAVAALQGRGDDRPPGAELDRRRLFRPSNDCSNWWYYRWCFNRRLVRNNRWHRNDGRNS